MVDFRALSREIGVSDRRLYAVWPSPEDFNADLVELVIAGTGSTARRPQLQALADRPPARRAPTCRS